MRAGRATVSQEGSLWVARSERPKPLPIMWVRRFFPREKVVTLADGRRARIHVDETKSVKHIETNDTLDCTVRVRPIILQVRRER